MEKLAIALWGCYFGTVAWMLLGSVLAYARSLRRVAVNAALAALASGFFVLAFLGGLPISNADTMARFLAQVAGLVAVLLTYLLLAVLGVLKSGPVQQRVGLVLIGLGMAILGAGWMLQPQHALALGLATAGLLACVALAMSVRSVLRGDRLARLAAVGVFSMLVALAGLSWIALDREHAPWLVHAVSAAAATLYLSAMAWVLWARYAYLIELHKVMAYGPSYDPVTRLRSHSETGHLVGAVFKSFRKEPQPLGMMVISIANLYALEQLHGAAAINHALFVTAGRMRRVVPDYVEMGRLGHDGFLLMMRNCRDSGQLINLARRIQFKLSKPLVLNTNSDVTRLEAESTVWVASVGVSVLMISNPEVGGASALAMAKGMSLTAMSYASRIAWFDHGSGEIVELPVLSQA
jgi:GGDEF domain-containing protein